MFKIGEFSKLVGVSIRMLRHYGDNGLLKPTLIDEQTHYRLYSASQVAELQQIIRLRDMGFNVKEMASLIDSWSKDALHRALLERKEGIEKTIEAEQRKLQLLKKMISDTQNGLVHPASSVSILRSTNFGTS